MEGNLAYLQAINKVSERATNLTHPITQWKESLTKTTFPFPFHNNKAYRGRCINKMDYRLNYLMTNNHTRLLTNTPSLTSKMKMVLIKNTSLHCSQIKLKMLLILFK